MPLLDPRVHRLYMCYVDRREQQLQFPVNWVVVARLVEDAARGRQPAVCMLLHMLMHAPHRAVTRSLSL